MKPNRDTALPEFDLLFINRELARVRAGKLSLIKNLQLELEQN